MQIAKLFLLTTLIFNFSCKNKDEIKPLSQTKQLKFNAVDLEISTQLDTIKIKKDFIRKITGTLFGWIPIIGDILELPVDLSMKLASAIIPPLPVRNDIPVKPGGSWNDPEVLKLVTSVKLVSGRLKVLEREKTGFLVFNQTPEDLTFLREIRVYLVFKTRDAKEVLVLLAEAKSDTDFNIQTQELKFTPSFENIKPYYDKYGQFEVRTLASGKIPPGDMLIGGSFNVLVTLQLPQPF